MNAVVTGGAGFIGSHLVDRILGEEGNTVTVLDNFYTGRPENLARHRNNKSLAVIRSDISDLDEIVGYFKAADTVFHLAALADIVPSVTNPAAYFRSNVSGTFSVAEAARRGGVKRFVYAASSSCYGIPDSYPTSENAEIRPEYPYALTKRLGEEIALHWGRVYKLPVVSLRLFNVYGPRARTSGAYGAVLGVFLAQKIHNKPLTIVGDGTQKRDFIYVTDAAEAFMKAAHSSATGEIYNVGSGSPQTINRLAELVGGGRVNIPKRPGEPDCTWADISKIKSGLGWMPRVSFEEGIEKAMRELDHWKAAPVWTPETIKQATAEWFQFMGRR